MDLVDEKDDVARGLDLADKALDALLELAAELGARDEGRHVQQVDLLVLQAGRDLALGDALGNALGDGRLAHACLADEAGVVLLAAAEDLDGTVDLPVAADDAVGLAVPGFLGQVFAVSVQELAPGGFLPPVFPLLALFAARARGAGAEGEGGRTARHKIVLGRFLGRILPGGGQRAGLGGFLQEGAHAFLHIFQVLIGHAELFHQIVDRLDMQRPGAGQAVAFLQGLAVFNALHKDDCGTFFAAYTKHGTFTSL